MNQHPAYELFEELGRGTNTVVYRSYDLSLGREVAIKELDENSRRDPRQRERFLREAQFLAQFEHDNVLRVYAVDTERGWIIMELMKGTLASVIAQGPSDPDLVRSILKQTLDALAFLHDKNKVHSTVRPTNVLINDAGRVKLSEFEQTDIGGELRAPKGSKKYLAPELIKPEFGAFGPALDLYCLAFTALELLKGPQFDGMFPGTGKGAIDADMAWLRWHSSPEELASTRKLVKGIPDDLAHVLDRMLKKQVADRPQSAQEVLTELADRPLVAVPIAGSDATDTAAPEQRAGGPAVVRTLSAPQSVSPRGNSPVANVTEETSRSSTVKSAHTASSKGRTKLAAAAFSKDWFNQQLGRPYVLYPLCAIILFGALWFSFFRSSADESAEAVKKGSEATAKSEPSKPILPATVTVGFEVAPNSAGLEVAEGSSKVSPTPDGKYAFIPGRHTLTFRKDGFQPLTSEIDVSAEHNSFPVKLTPVVKFADVVIQVLPPSAQLKVGGTTQALTNGAFTQKIEVGKSLEIDARLAGYKPVTRSISAGELAKTGNKVTISLERAPAPVAASQPEKPIVPTLPDKRRLPASLVAKPGAALDPNTQLPVRVFARRLGSKEPMELALVKPGTYKYGSPEVKLRRNELPQRTVRIEQPFYIAITETTNTQYNRFFESEGEAKAGIRWQKASRKWSAPLHLDPVQNRLPVTNVSTQQAQAFCRWIGGQLPTEIQWECAVRGTDDRGYPFPWGSDQPDREHCRIFNGEKLERGEGGPVPVDQLAPGTSPLGLTHMIGNADELCFNSEKDGNFILRGCSIATANIDDVRVTWRGRGEMAGEESTGFRVIFPISVEPTKPAETQINSANATGITSLSSPFGLLFAVPWKSVFTATNSLRNLPDSKASVRTRN